MKLRRLFATLSAFAIAVPASAAVPVAGRWITQDGSGLVEIASCGKTVCGRLARVLKPRPGAPATDVNNPDAALRSRPLIGLPILSGFADAGTEWQGSIYDPRSGKTYRSILQRNPDGTLKLKGCVLLFCQTQIWRPAR